MKNVLIQTISLAIRILAFYVAAFLRTLSRLIIRLSNFSKKICRLLNFFRAKDKIVTSVPEICQDCLLCEDHRKPFRFLEHPYSLPITKDEWGILVDAYRQVIPDQPTPTEIVLLNGGGRLLAGNCCFQVFSGALDFCDECYALWGIREEEKRYNYPEGANIFVRLVSFFATR